MISGYLKIMTECLRSKYFHFSAVGALLIVLSVGFPLTAVSFSKEQGRLSGVPLYDDCVYFLKSATMVEHFRQGRFVEGMPAPLHSPFSVLLAGGAFAVFGHEDFAPYLANSVILFVFLVLLLLFLRPVSFAALVPLLIFFLCLPFAGLAVLEFRPDLAWGILVGAMGALLVIKRSVFRSWRTAMCVGLLLAACLLTKPTTFAMTGLIYVGGTVASLVVGWFENRNKVWWVHSIRGFLISVLIAGLVILPYLIYEGNYIFDYFVINSFGFRKDVWKVTGDWKEQLGFYSIGWGGQSNLGVVGLLLLIWIFLAISGVAFRGRPVDRLRIVFGVILVMCVYVVNTMALAKTPFLGAAIYGLLFFLTAWLLSQLWILFPKIRTNLVVAWWVTAFIACVIFRWPPVSILDSELAAFQKLAHREVYSLIRANSNLGPESRVLVLQPGPVIPEVLALWAIREGSPFQHVSGGVITSEDNLLEELSLAQIVVSQNSGVIGAPPYLPVESLLDSANRILAQDSSFKLLGEIKDKNQKSIYIYGRKM